MGPVLSVPGLPGPFSRGIMDLGRLPGWESVSFFRTVLTHPILILWCHLMTPWILPSPNTIEPLLDLLIFRPPLLSTSLHAASIDLSAEFPTRSGPLIHHHHPSSSLLPMVVPPIVASIPATLSASALLHRPTVALLASRPTLFPLLVVHFCSSSLILPLSSVGCHVKSVSWGGGGGCCSSSSSSSSSSFSSPPPARRPNPSSTPASWPSSHQRFRRHPLAPHHHCYPPLNLASHHD